MLLSKEIMKDQWVGIPGYASMSTSAGACLHRSGMDPRVCASAPLRLGPRITKAREAGSQSQTFAFGGDGATCTSSFQGGAIEDRADPGIHA